MYPEYDPNDPSLGQAFANMLRGFQNPQQWQEAGTSLKNALQLTPNVTESLGRGGVGQAIGTMGDLRDIRNTVQSYLPKSVQNFSNAAEFMTNPYAKALIQTAPTTEKVLETVPRVTPEYEGFKQHETLGEFVAPSLGYFGGKALKAGKNLPVGLSIEDVTPPPAKVAEALRQPEKNALGFYSPLDEAVMNLQNPKGTGQQYLAQLLKTGGVKPEEVATRGLDTFLESNPKVSREQIAQYLRENPVELKETVIGGDTTRNLNTMRYDDYYLDEGRVLDDPDYVSSRADDIYLEEYKNNPEIKQEVLEDLVRQNPEKYADYETNPSIYERLQRDVDNELYSISEERAQADYDASPFMEHTDDLGYRVTGNDDIGYQVIDPQGNPLTYRNNGEFDLGQAEEAIREDALNRGLLHLEEDEYGTKYHDYTLPNGENYREVLIQYPDVIGKDFQSGHFDEPNILAHFRTTDRTIDGKKTLFVEEIQSDWHQAGRKKGYQTPKGTLPEGYKVAEEMNADNQPVWVVRDKKGESVGFGANKDEAVNSLRPTGVPDAPFKKNWQELAMKRAMQMAAEGGYDRVAFTTGKQQASRYSLSKQIDSVDLIPAKEGDKQYVMQAWKDGRNVIRKAVNEDELPDLIGKEAAKKLLEQEPTDLHRPEGIAHGNPNVFKGRELKGLDLDVGGEGMKGFYDKILPDFINKYGKKHGLKVGKTALVPPDQAYLLRGSDGHVLTSVKTKEKAEQYIKDMVERDPSLEGKLSYEKGRPEEDIHYFDLTPEAKESFLKKGQPMFAAAPAIGITDEDTRREVLEKLFKNSGN